MSGFDSLFSSAEQQYGLPPGILAATAHVESRLNPQAVSPKGALGLMQIMPATAQALGVNPLDPAQAVQGAAKLWHQNLQASGGDIDKAAMMYNAGPKPSHWNNPETRAYPGKLAAALGPQTQGGGDPIEAALSGQPTDAPTAASPAPPQAPADPHDPIESALAGSAPDRQSEIASAQAQASKQLAAGDEAGAIKTLADHNLQMGPGELDAFHAGKRSPGFNHVDQAADQPPPQTSQGLGLFEGIMKPWNNAAIWLEHGADKVGLAKPINDPGAMLWAMLGGAPSPEAAVDDQRAYVAKNWPNSKPGGWGQFAGSVLSSLPIAAATKNPAVLGAIGGALDSDNPNDAGQVAKNAIIGGVGGKLIDGATSAVSRVVSPQVSAAVQKLHDLGVQLTPGQIMGGALKRIEDGATSIPFLGDLVKNAQQRSSVSLNTGVINDRVLSPIGRQLPSGMTGRDAVNFADDQVSNAYHELLPKLTLKGDQQLAEGVSGILHTTNELPSERANQVVSIIKNTFGPKFGADWSMTGNGFKEADAKIGQLAREYSSSADPEQRKMGGIFRDVQGEFRAALQRSNPAQAPELGNINQAFSNLVRVEGAASSAGAKGGVFTPAQLGSAVRRFDPSVRKKGYATGNAPMQDISDAAQEVLPSSVPDSGTPFRTVGAYLLGGGLSHVSPWAAPVAAPFALYSKVGQRAFQKAALAPRGPTAKALGKALTNMKAPLAVAGGGAAAQATNGF